MIYNVVGEKVRTIDLGTPAANTYHYVAWDGKNDSGNKVASGVYIGVLKVGGAWVSPHEVESALIAHPAVLEAAVVGVPDETWGETPSAVVVRRSGAEVGGDELVEFCRERLARYKCPRTVEFRDELPKSPSGKVLRRLLREERVR